MPSAPLSRRLGALVPVRTLLLGLALLALMTVLAATMRWCVAALAGVVLLQLASVLTVLVAVRSTAAQGSAVGAAKAGAKGSTKTSGGGGAKSSGSGDVAALTTRVRELEGRLDALGARVLASSERTRIEVLDALARRDETDAR